MQDSIALDKALDEATTKLKEYSLNEPDPNQGKYDTAFSIIQKDSSDNISKTDSSNSIIKKSTFKRSDFEEDQQLLLKKKSQSEIKEYLVSHKWNYRKDDFVPILEQKIAIFVNNINYREFSYLKNSVEKCKITSATNSSRSQRNEYEFEVFNIGPISTLEYMVETTFIGDLSKKIKLHKDILELEEHIFRWRSVKGDGNCFYRSLIFSFLENIVINKNIQLLKEFTINFSEKMSFSNPLASKYSYIQQNLKNIDKNLVEQILLLIIVSMENQEYNSSPYEILVKSFLFCRMFDEAMIYFLRYMFLEYIDENRNKEYTAEFSIKIGNLLPHEFQNEKGEFLYEGFFENNLMCMGVDAEKIIIYVAPFVLNCNLKVVMYEFEYEDSVSYRNFLCGGESEYEIEVLFRVTHYDIIYSKNYFIKFQNELCLYVNLKENFKTFNSEFLRKCREAKREGKFEEFSQKNISLISEEKPSNVVPYQCMICKNQLVDPGVFSLCDKCLELEVQSQVAAVYLTYLSEAYSHLKRFKADTQDIFDKFFLSKKCMIGSVELNMLELLNGTRRNLDNLLKPSKGQICAFCLVNLSGPPKYSSCCGCNFCSSDCYKNFYNYFLVQDNEAHKNGECNCSFFSMCICGHKFSMSDYREMFSYFNKKKFDKFMKSLKEMVSQKCERCIGCFNGKKSLKKIKLKYKGLDGNDLVHYVCKSCLEKFESLNREVINCKICNESHKVSEVQPKGGDCVIF